MKYALNILLLFTLFQSSAQNLVPNPSFEQFSLCPDMLGQINYATGWSGYSQSPDYFNSCNSNSVCDVPYNTFGYQMSATGNGYIGLAAYYDNGFGTSTNTREFVGINLTQSLSLGQKYYVSFKANLSLSVLGWTNTAINNLGAWFTTVPNQAYVNNQSQIYTSNIVTDTVDWQLIKGSFVADSAYNYILLGNFMDDSLTDTTVFFNLPGAPDKLAYYYLDDICVSTDSLTCFGSVGLSELSKPGKKIIRVVDTMGRETEDKPNTLLIYIYSDGTTEKVFRVE